MTKVFKSKIGLELVIPLIVIFGSVVFIVVSEKPSWFGVAILSPAIFFTLYLFMTTYYVVNGNELTIRCGFLVNKTIDINSIKKISETNNPLSSPATSLDRLEITYGNFDSIIISPKRKIEFINEITSLNPNVQVKFKKKRNETPGNSKTIIFKDYFHV
ncbi:MAG: PH domain-containing protein [Cyclobacteriaceae bacterium]|nr:PH domain-containing protein [Cyclobacteriaceae bacterium]